MGTPFTTLASKELRQNSLVYLVPLPFLLLLLLLRQGGGLADPPAWLEPVFLFAVPLALAVAYGLQAFDVEIERQTRDFLLTKPLSIRRIVGVKFLPGLVFLVLWTLLLNMAVNASFLEWPRVLPVSTWLAGLVLAGSILTYGGAFFCGILVEGPKKLMAASLAGAAAIVWFFAAWSSLVTYLLQEPSFFPRHPLLLRGAFYLAAFVPLAAGLGLELCATAWFLRGRPSLWKCRSLAGLALCVLLLPALALGLNFGANPPLRAARFLGLELFGLDLPFWAAGGAFGPDGATLVVTGPGNTLGLAALHGKPSPIYAGKPGRRTLEDLAWSPDGRYIAFEEDGVIRVLKPNGGRPVAVGKGSAPCWSKDGKVLVFCGQKTPPYKARLEDGSTGVFYGLDLFAAKAGSWVARPFAQIIARSAAWHWDSDLGAFLFVAPSSRVEVLRREGLQTFALPDLKPGGGGIVWYRFYPRPGPPGRYVLAVVSVTDMIGADYTVRFYALDVARARAVLIRRLRRLRFTDLILDPRNGRCLLGNNGVYGLIELYKR